MVQEGVSFIKDIRRRRRCCKYCSLLINTVSLVLDLGEVGLSSYMIFVVPHVLFWWGFCSLVVTTFYYPLLVRTPKLKNVIIVLFLILAVKVAAAGLLIRHVLRRPPEHDDFELKCFTVVKSLHLGVIFGVFTYYWRIYAIAIVEFRRGSVGPSSIIDLEELQKPQRSSATMYSFK
ncbi:uncharacterized protein LOC126747492 isoform X2 [Anthonomus grandis grandis]|uniref:uncharacterized protein LOC126747492 isoform X2 n=1 Tax=Anthonomus grandis grandis TaxID=2921223 RepID=UPI002165C135|nr:uncharacterized protein LOC126747492 isoform X2 [Anthonomus grandis grandis]